MPQSTFQPLQESPDLFRLFQFSPDMLCVANFDGFFVRVNPAFSRILGHSAADLTSQPFIEFVHPDDRDSTLGELSLMRNGRQTINFENRYRCADGSYRVLSWNATPELGDDVIFAVARDITEMKLTESKLHTSNELLKGISKAQSLQICRHQPNELFEKLLTSLLEVSKSEFGFIGEVFYEPDGTPFLKTHAITNIAWNDETRQFYEENAPSGMEFRNLQTLFGFVLTEREPVITNDPVGDARSGGTPDGHPVLKSFMGMPFFLEGEMLGMVGIANRPGGYDEGLAHMLEPLLASCSQVINGYRLEGRRVNAMTQLRDNETRIQSILDTAADAIISIDRNGQVISFNSAAESMFGYSAETIIGENISTLMPSPHRERHDTYLSDYFRTGKKRVIGIGREAEGRRKDGTTFPIELSVSQAEVAGQTMFTGIVRDISERKLADSQLAEVNAQLASVLDASTQVSIIATDVQGTITVFNSGAERMLGYTADEMVGKLTPASFHLQSEVEARGVELSNEFDRAVSGFDVFVAYAREGRFERREWTYIRNDGQHLTVSLVVTAVRDTSDKITGFLGVAEDITERNRADEALRKSEERFNLAVAGSNDGLWDRDIQSNKAYFSPRFKELIGYTDDELESSYEAWVSRLHDDDRERVLSALHDHLVNRTPYDVEYRLMCKSGLYRWFRARGQAIWDEQGRATRMAGSLTDTTDRTLSQKELQMAKDALYDSEQQLRTIIEATPECVKLVDAAGRLLEMNSVGLAYIEAESFEEVKEVCVYPIIADEYRDQFRQMNEQVCRGQKRTLQFEIVGLRGTRRFMETTAVPLTTLDGETVQLAITREITERKRKDAALKAAKEAAEAASLAKSEFLANMSHEIRTPMNGIIGMTDLVLDTELSPEQREYIETVKNSGDALLTLIDDILDFSKIEAGKLDLEAAPFELRQTLEETLRTLSIRAQHKGLDVSWKVAEDVPPHLVGDSHRLRQVLVNLVGNAIKFTPEGAVRVQAVLENQVHDQATIHFQVSDTGIGISIAQQSEIFESFNQADTSTTRTFGGTGLGLAIASQLAELMGGRMWVESEIGQGSVFHFTAEFSVGSPVDSTVRRRIETDPEAVTARVDKQCSLHILLAEDHLVNQRFASRLLEKEGHSVTIAENGREAVEIYKAQPVDLILMDIQMPGTDGFEATAEIRAYEQETGQHTPIIAMTAHAMKGDRDRCLAGGMDGYISKPVARVKLLSEIDHMVHGLRANKSKNNDRRTYDIEDAVYNHESALRHVGGDDELLKELIDLHLTETPKLISQIGDALRLSDCQTVKEKAHTLKGSMGLLCAERASDAARILEQCAATGNAFVCDDDFAKLKAELDELKDALASIIGPGRRPIVLDDEE